MHLGRKSIQKYRFKDFTRRSERERFVFLFALEKNEEFCKKKHQNISVEATLLDLTRKIKCD